MTTDLRRARPARGGPRSRLRLLAVALGPLLLLAVLLLPAPAGLEPAALRLVGLTGWMVAWWLTEVVPIPVTALLPIPLMPALGIAPEAAVTAQYGHPLVFLFLGGFVLAGALRRWGLHRRLALAVVARAGARPAGLVGGAMLATAFLSMWVSNTATAVLMYAVGVSLVEAVRPLLDDDAARRRFARALLLGIAYAASIGGLATLVGTPPNVLLAGYLASAHGLEIGFAEWLLVGLPVAALLLPLAWAWLTRLAFPVTGLRLGGARELVRRELAELGPMGPAERSVLAVFALTALAWVARPALVRWTGLPLGDGAIAIAAAVALFALPASLERGAPLLDWGVARHVAWDVLLLFGGGLALAAAFDATGLAAALGGAVAGLAGVPTWLLLAGLTTLVLVLGELTSNTASAATFLPIAGAVAVGVGSSPLLFAAAVALAASANFALPIATPPNAVVFAHEDVRMRDMLRAGLALDALALTVILGLLPLVARLATGG